MTPQAPSSLSVSAGNSATYTVAIAGTNGFTSNVAVTCTLPAAATTCTASPASVAPGSNTTLTITTTTHQLLPPTWTPRRFAPWQKTAPIMVLTLFLLLLAIFAARTRRQRLVISAPLAGVILFLLLQAVGCSSSNGGNTHGTQAGTYTVTVTGTSGGTTHTTTVALTVN